MSKPPGPKEQKLRDQRAAKADTAEKVRKLIPYAGKPTGERNSEALMGVKNRKPK